MFCSEFFTDYCDVVRLGLARTTYAKIAKNRRKIGQNSLFVTRFSPNWDRNRKIPIRQALAMLMACQTHWTIWFYLFHGPNCTASSEHGQKIEKVDFLRGRIRIFFLSTFFRRIFWCWFWWYLSFWFWTTWGREKSIFLILDPTQGNFT